MRPFDAHHRAHRACRVSAPHAELQISLESPRTLKTVIREVINDLRAAACDGFL
jgi:hypothetical protein